MGMFDTVWFDCPLCGEQASVQSKAGECRLHDYNFQNVPPDIAAAIKDEIVYCAECGGEFYIRGNVFINLYVSEH